MIVSRDFIIAEIRRLADENGGRPLGKRAFEAETGIKEGKWYGVHWTRWNDAVEEAGYKPNEKQMKFDSADLIRKIAEFALELNQIPNNPVMRMRRRIDPSFPNPKTVNGHFGSQTGMIDALRRFCISESKFQSIIHLFPLENQETRPYSPDKTGSDGWVYLLKSGDTFKLGCSANLEKRVKQINVALPEAATLYHAIQTDDPFGIEAYWHSRFADLRLNGEWFKLGKQDLAAFRRRKFM